MAEPSADPAGALSDLPRRRRKRRSAEIRNSLRLGLLLAGLVGINVYVFFFNRGTAPREVLKPASMVKSAEGRKEEIVKQSAAQAAVNPRQPSPPRATGPGGAKATVGGAQGTPAMQRQTQTKTPTQAPAPRPLAAIGPPPPASQAPRPLIQIPFAPPDSDAVSAKGAREADSEDESDPRAAEKKIGAADTLGQVLAREGFGSAGGAVVAALSKLCDPKLIRGGQIYQVRLDDQGTPELFEYQPTPVLRYQVERGSGGAWKARKLEQAVDTRPVEAAGVVESSLYESVQKAGESSALVSLLVELFAWDVNFYTDTHPGDRWKVVVEKQYLGGQFYKYGRILAAEYGGRTGLFRAFYWKLGKSQTAPGKYYDEHGQAIAKTMLKTPLRYVRISSKFDLKRFHPILHREKAHLGIDYAAPVGTPVWASAGGRVVEAEMKRGSGNTVVLSHSNGLSTRYYHLSRFARGLRPGQTVRQKDVIGYVGTTGLSTGPHLHFSVTKNGAFVDPSKLQVSRDPSVPERAAFLDAIRPRLAMLRSMQPAALARN
jgi:murein DD-endopeptidase MepM/ murein hydrolase activator NlpD